jgi:hypothetical protein
MFYWFVMQYRLTSYHPFPFKCWWFKRHFSAKLSHK